MPINLVLTLDHAHASVSLTISKGEGLRIKEDDKV